MRRALLASLSLVALAGAAYAQRPAAPVRDNPARTQGRGTDPTPGIHGVVIDGQTRRALAKTRVQLSSDNGFASEPLFTDRAGQFAYDALAPGHYTLALQKTGYARLRYGARTELDPPIEITIDAGSPPEDVVIALTKGAAIYGRVTDDAGDPIVGGEVSIGAMQVIGNALKLVPVGRPIAETNDLGEYRIGDLPPGRYFVSVAGAGIGTLAPGAPREWERLVAWGKTFYPGASSLSESSSITVGAGEEHGGADFSVRPFARTRLLLNLAGLQDSPALNQQQIALLGTGDLNTTVFGNQLLLSYIPAPDSGQPVRTGTLSLQASFTGPISSVNSFEPGDWIVLARQQGNAGLAHVHLSAGDDATVNLDIAKASTVRGRVIFNGARPPALNTVTLAAHGAGPDAAIPMTLFQPVPASLGPDGTFQIANLFGTIDLLATVPAGWILQSVNYQGRDLLDEPLTLTPGENVGGVEVVLTDQVVSVAGVTVGADGSPSGGCTVALFPEERATKFTPRRMRLVRSDQRGQFRVRDVPFGAYRVAAALDIDAASWLTEDSLDRLRARSVPITLTDRSRPTATLPCGEPQ